MRGHIQINIKISGASQDCHSGVHGGAFSEPISDLICVLSKLKDSSNGKILIPGFYDNILPLKIDEIKLYDEIINTFNTNDYLQSIGYNDILNINNKNNHNIICGKELLMKKWRKPSSMHNIKYVKN